METFLWGLATLAVSGLAFFGYRHPEAFRFVAWPLLMGGITVFVTLLGWDLGRTEGYEMLAPMIPEAQRPAAQRIIEDARVPVGRAGFFLLLFAIFLAFLWLLPYLIADEVRRQSKKAGDEESDLLRCGRWCMADTVTSASVGTL